MNLRPYVAALILMAGCRAGASNPDLQPQAGSSRFLFVWAGDADRQQSDFLAVVDVDPRSPSYATVVATVPAGAVGTRPHHTEHAMPEGGILWANGFDSGTTYRFDLRDPLHPRLLGAFGDVASLSHPHSYARLPNGHLLATFQHRAGDPMKTGGLVELDTAGRVIRSSDASAPAIDSGVRPYSLLVLPNLDRVVTTATDMHLQTRSRAVQVWRLSDLALLKTILLPPGPQGDENSMTAEPRVLSDGRTVLVNTFHCGLYRLRGVEGDAPSAEWIYSTPWREPPFCAIPIVAGRYWVQTNGPERYVVSLDVSDPDHPREVSRLTLGADQVPHWIALEPGGDRIVVTGYRGIESRVLIAKLDRRTGALSLDSAFHAPGDTLPGVSFDRAAWPHGASGRAIPHGAVFSRP